MLVAFVACCRLCADTTQQGEPSITMQLVKGSVDEVKLKGHDLCLKVTSTINGEKQIFLSFTDKKLYGRWRKRCKKVCVITVIYAHHRIIAGRRPIPLSN